MTLSGCFRALAASVLTLWVTGVVLSAQKPSTLGEIARKEEERRKKVSAPAKVYTNRDLPKPSGAAPPAASAAEAAATQKPAETQKPEEPGGEEKPEGEEKNEDWWRKRITAARVELKRNEMAAEAFQSRINALTTDFSARDDPYQRAQISLDRQQALNELERVKAEIVRVKQVIADIEEEARVAGVPPGWLR